jgi:putative membrane protein
MHQRPAWAPLEIEVRVAYQMGAVGTPRPRVHTNSTHTSRHLLRRLRTPALFYVLYVGGIYYLHEQLKFTVLDLTMAISTVLGISVSLLLGFRTSAAYDRWWEARKVWGGIVNDSRTFVRQLHGFVAAGERDSAVRALAHQQIAWCKALRSHLRSLDPLEGLEDHLPDTELRRLTKQQNVPNAILATMQREAARLRADGALDPFGHLAIDGTMRRLCDHLGRCERINNTVFPVDYEVYTRWGIVIFILMLPFGMLDSTDLFVIPICLLVALFFATIEGVAHQLQDPFRSRGSDTPMTALCNTIEIDLRQMIGDEVLPPKLEPDERGVLM